MVVLLDSGARASEVCKMNIEDFNEIGGAILIRHGKRGQDPKGISRKESAKELRAYLRTREDEQPALFVSRFGQERLTYSALEQSIERAAIKAEVKNPTPHSFRRAFAINCLRAGMDVYSLKELMGHEDLQVLQRILKLTKGEIETAHRQFSPVDRM